MKKIIMLLFAVFILCVNTPQAISKQIKGGVSFDWVSKSQFQRDSQIKKISGILFNENTKLKYSKQRFKYEYSPYFRDKAYKDHYIAISNGIGDDNEKKYSGFFRGKNLYMYAFQYKDNPYRVFYYNALGYLHYIDFLSPEYPSYPYYSEQYATSGRLVGTIYFESKDKQYIFNPKKEFKGVWYKENMYDRKGKVILTRTNW